MSKKVIIASDSTTDLSREIIEKYSFRILPLLISLGEDTHTDGVDIVPQDIYDYFAKTGELPKTAAVSIGEYENFFSENIDEEHSMVFFTVSSSMSSSFQNATIAAESFEDIYVVDSENLSTGAGLLMIKAAEWADEGFSAAEIAEKAKALAPYVDASFVIDNLMFLYKGGRCSAVSMLGANVLKLKPCIEVKHGAMSVGKKYRGKYGDVLLEYMRERLGDCSDVELDHIFVTHAGCPKAAEPVYEAVKKYAPFKNVYFTTAGSTVASHCGQYTLGVLFIRKTPVE